MERKFDVIFSETEAQALFALLHLAVKSAGLEGPYAANAIHFQQKINKAFEESKVRSGKVLEMSDIPKE